MTFTKELNFSGRQVYEERGDGCPSQELGEQGAGVASGGVEVSSRDPPLSKGEDG